MPSLKQNVHHILNYSSWGSNVSPWTVRRQSSDLLVCRPDVSTYPSCLKERLYNENISKHSLTQAEAEKAASPISPNFENFSRSSSLTWKHYPWALSPRYSTHNLVFKNTVPHCDEVILRDRDVVQLDAVPYQREGWLHCTRWSWASSVEMTSRKVTRDAKGTDRLPTIVFKGQTVKIQGYSTLGQLKWISYHMTNKPRMLATWFPGMQAALRNEGPGPTWMLQSTKSGSTTKVLDEHG